MKKRNKIFYIIIVFSLLVYSCGNDYSPEQKTYIAKIEDQRIGKNSYMKFDLSSPFNLKRKVEFHTLNYFKVDPAFVFKSRLFEYYPKDTVIIYGTKGEKRKAVRFGYSLINYENQDYKVNVYQNNPAEGTVYYSIWFTDNTTNKESYGVGRYIDFEKQDDPNYIYEIDFNLAYNPYCAYSADFSCAIPTKEDFIPIAIRAGEKKFHD